MAASCRPRCPALLQSQAYIVDLTEAYGQLAALVPHGPAPEPPAVVAEPPRRPLGFNPVTPDFAECLLMDQAELVKIADLLWERKQIILYGPPGTGKTYLARELARHLTDDGAVKLGPVPPVIHLRGLLRRLPARAGRQRHPDLHAARRAVQGLRRGGRSQSHHGLHPDH